MVKTSITIECKEAVDKLQFNPADFVEFLKTNIKVDRKRGNIGTKLTIEFVKDANTVVLSSNEVNITRYYTRFLSKKFIAQTNDGSFHGAIRMITNKKGNFQLRVNEFAQDEE